MKYDADEIEIVINGKTFPPSKDAPICHGHYMCTKCPKCDRYRYCRPLPSGEQEILCGCPKP